LGRAALIDRHTLGRLSAQVFVDRPSGGTPGDQQGRAGYDYDAEHNSISFWNNPKGRSHIDEDRPAHGSLSKKR
jgi:hypothetical protein